MLIRIHSDGQDLGPFSLEQVNRSIAESHLSPADLALPEGASAWVKLADVPGVLVPPVQGELAGLSLCLSEVLNLCCLYLVALDEQFTEPEQDWVDAKFGPGAADRYIQRMASMDWENCFAQIHTLLNDLDEPGRDYITGQSPALFQDLLEADGVTGAEQERLDHLMQFIRDSIGVAPPPALAPVAPPAAPIPPINPSQDTPDHDAPPNPDVVNRITNSVYGSTAPARTQLADLQALSALDKESEVQIKECGKKQFLNGCGAVFLGLAGVALGALGVSTLVAGGYAWWLTTVAVVIVIVLLALAGLLGRFAYQAWIKKKAFEQHEYPDYRYLTCLKIVELLNADMIAESSLQTSLTLRPNPVAAPPTPAATPPLNAPANAGVSPPVLGQAAAPPVLNPNQPPPLASPNPAGVPPVINPASGSAQSMPFGDQSGKRGHVSWMSRHTHETWLQLSSQLQDGTKFDFSLREDSQAYGEHFPYRAMSGKTKTKLKARKRLQWIVSLRLRFKEKRYPAGPAESAQLTQLIQLPEGAKVKKLDVSGQEFRLTAATAPKKLRAKRKGSTDIVGAWNGMQPTDEDWQPLTQFSAMTFLSLYQALNASRKV